MYIFSVSDFRKKASNGARNHELKYQDFGILPGYWKKSLQKLEATEKVRLHQNCAGRQGSSFKRCDLPHSQNNRADSNYYVHVYRNLGFQVCVTPHETYVLPWSPLLLLDISAKTNLYVNYFRRDNMLGSWLFY